MFKISTRSNGDITYNPKDIEATKTAIQAINVSVSKEDVDDPLSNPITRDEKNRIEEAKNLIQNPYFQLSLSSNILPANGTGTEKLTVQAKDRLQIDLKNIDPSNADNISFNGVVNITIGDNLYKMNLSNGSATESVMTSEPSGSVVYASISENSSYKSNSVQVNVQ